MMSEMSPEDLAKQMQDAMELFGSDDMMDNLIGQQEEILQKLVETGNLDVEELAKYKADPEYFLQKMMESMDDQMIELIYDPNLMANAAEGMKAAQEMYNNPDAINDKRFSDEDIESLRQMFLRGGRGDAMDAVTNAFGSIIHTAEVDEVLQDPVKWRKQVKEGFATQNIMKMMRMTNAAEGMKAAQEMYNNPDAMNDKRFSDEDIESLRQMFLGGGRGDAMDAVTYALGSIYTAELDEVLQDPVKWRKQVKEGLDIMGLAGEL